ncbi:dynein regulatory complex protein 1 [Leptopilina heterotoma]|uniref:dynein regulatory complex protein 1 n=1 Tax=Leptopilina heterotoma TaxID=63436 RepID=UPI001CA8103B|nr:dynein regulatory complex protein 1 [Leptopilina heterotoma]
MDGNSKENFNESEEPSVTSDDPNERKLARRIRIQKRQEALKEEVSVSEIEEEEVTNTEKQILTSAEQLDKFITDGNRMVTNVKVANDARELQRRAKENEIRQNLLEMLEKNAGECMERYQEINSKWTSILESKDPLDIHSEMITQNEKCLAVLALKDSAIDNLKKELKIADEKFHLDLKKQTEDIDILIDRIDHHVNTMAKSFRKELAAIENTLQLERESLLEVSAKKWETLYNQRAENEIQGIEKRKEIMKEFQLKMNQVRIEHHEEYRAQKIKLEIEQQKLQQQIQQMKAICMLNVEKLDYNYNILKRREDENAIIKNHQKRKLNKLHDTISDLKKTYSNLEENTKLEMQKLSDQVLRAHKNILDLEEKSDLFTAINEKNYMEIWEMNSKIANDLFQKILTADKLIFDQVLGLEWEAPKKKLLKKEDLVSYMKAMNVIEQKKKIDAEKMKMCEPYKPATTLEEINLERKLLVHIMKLISDRAGFLIEDKLKELLLNHSSENQIIVRLDSVFQALCIDSPENIDMLMNFFLPYTYCPICIDNEKDESQKTETNSTPIEEDNEEPEDEPTRKLIETVKEEVAAIFTPCRISRSSESTFAEKLDCTSSKTDKDTIEGSRSIEELSCDCPDDLKKRKVTCDAGHILQIQVTHVIRALTEFLEKYHSIQKGESTPDFKEKLINQKFTISRNIQTEDITKFWGRYREIFNEEKETLWDALLIGLNKYHDILKERHKLNEETESLRQQNSELHRLLKTYKQPENILRT